MEKEIIEEICKNLNWYDKIIVKIFKNVSVNVYHIGRINCLRSRLKK